MTTLLNNSNANPLNTHMHQHLRRTTTGEFYITKELYNIFSENILIRRSDLDVLTHIVSVARKDSGSNEGMREYFTQFEDALNGGRYVMPLVELGRDAILFAHPTQYANKLVWSVLTRDKERYTNLDMTKLVKVLRKEFSEEVATRVQAAYDNGAADEFEVYGSLRALYELHVIETEMKSALASA